MALNPVAAIEVLAKLRECHARGESAPPALVGQVIPIVAGCVAAAHRRAERDKLIRRAAACIETGSMRAKAEHLAREAARIAALPCLRNNPPMPPFQTTRDFLRQAAMLAQLPGHCRQFQRVLESNL